MACCKHVPQIVFTFVLVFLLMFPPHSTSNSDTSKVTLSLYYESLCPYCGNFIVNQLGKVFDTGLISIVNLRLIPWGNAHRLNSSSWTCQHGPDECLLNMVEACAINLWPDQKVHFKLIQCIELLVLSGKQNMWPSCLGEQHLNQELMNHCYKTATGTDLQLKNAYETEHLQTPHKFVPWVLVNNKTLEQDYQNYIARVCEAYTGPNKPAACSRTPKINSSDIGSSVPQVCYARKTDISFASEVKKAAKDLRRTEAQA